MKLSKHHLTEVLSHCSLDSSGFTLVELLIGSALTAVTVLLSGAGLNSVLRSTLIGNVENEQNVEINRALDYIAAEVRESKRINDFAGGGFTPSFTPSNEVDAASVRPILQLEIEGAPNPVVYYLAKQINPNVSLWSQPFLIYRWGPGFDANGQYQLPLPYRNHVLVDGIDDLPNEPGMSCPTGWTSSPAELSTARGFFACIDPANRIANLYQVGHFDQSELQVNPYQLNKQIYSRSSTVQSVVSPIPLDNNPFSLSSGQILIPSASTLSIKNLGGSINCPNGAVVTTTVTVLWEGNPVIRETLPPEGIQERPVTAGTRVSLEGTRESSACRPNPLTVHSVQDNGLQVLSLKNGASVPQITPYQNQAPIDSFLAEKLDSTGQRVNLKPNEVIFLFEVGEVASSSFDESAYDFQDIVVLAEVTPTDN